MPLEDAQIDDAQDTTNEVTPDELEQDAPQAQPPDSQAPAQEAPFPSSKNPKPVSRGVDGTVVFDNGVTRHPDGTLTWHIPEVGRTVVALPGQKPTWAPPDPRPANNNVIKDITDAETGIPQTALIDKVTGAITPVGNPSSRAAAQAEMLRIRLMNAAKSQPAIAGYINIKNNYDSLVQNAAIDPDKRTPADDAAAIQAFGAVEHPGTSVTDVDKQMVDKMIPKWTALKITASNWMKNKSQILPPETVSEMRDAAKRALDGRQKTYNEQVGPLLEEAKRMGMTPEQVNGHLGIMSAQPSQPTPPMLPANSPQEFILKNQNSQDPAVRQKVEQVKAALNTIIGGGQQQAGGQ